MNRATSAAQLAAIALGPMPWAIGNAIEETPQHLKDISRFPRLLLAIKFLRN